MCGIVGFADTKPFLKGDRLLEMRDTLAHRGPDSSGIRLWDENGDVPPGGSPAACGLGHCRLSIIDLSSSAHQPLANEDGSIWITYNGEFYDFENYRRELESAGHVFRSRCDTETIVHLYEEHGIAGTLARMNGMFAFGLWDANKQRLYLCRDRLGQKPLYYMLQPDGSILFASEIKALLASGLVDEDLIDPVALDQFWTFGYVVGERSIFAQIRRLLPGHYAVWENGAFNVREYWDSAFGVDVRDDVKEDDLVDELEGLLIDATRLRLRADVPVGVFLSGGIDSSLVAALTRKVAGERVRSYTIAFSHDEFNEAPYAKAVAAELGLDNTTLRVDEDLATSFPMIAGHFDEPFGDSSAIPTYFVSKMARAHVTVALTGDAGDELFAGYESYQNGLRLFGCASERRLFARPRTPRERLWDARVRFRGLARGYTLTERLMGRKLRRRLFSGAFRNETDYESVLRDRERWHERVARADVLSQMQYVNLKTYLPDDILVKVDRMSMAVSLETRSPFLDYRVVEFASRLPRRSKMSADGKGKLLLRKLLGRYVPEELFERPKAGFSVPWEHWCRGDMGRAIRERWHTASIPYFRQDAARMLFPDEGTGSSRLQWNAYVALAFFGA